VPGARLRFRAAQRKSQSQLTIYQDVSRIVTALRIDPRRPVEFAGFGDRNRD